jgi:uncharacterized Zn-binding protein involved in type VI secretion
MPQGVVRLGDANTGGGLVTMAGCDPTVLVNNRPIAIVAAPVTPHPPCGAPGQYTHCIAQLQFQPGTVLVNGKPIATWPSVDTCGHPRVTGSLDVILGGA